MMKKQLNLLVLTLFIVYLVFACTYAEAKQVSLEQIKERIFQKLNKLEGKNPPEQAEIFKIKLAVESLYRHAIAKKSTSRAMAPSPRALPMPTLPPNYDYYVRCKGLTNGALKRQLYGVLVNELYQHAQDTVFILLDNYDKKVEGVYTGKVIKTTTEPSPNVMNIEHTWPQSKGAKGWAKVDLHHLFPADSKANGIRGNLPFGNVTDPTWSEGGSSCDGVHFQVRKEQRGDTARAKFYFSVMYNMKIPAAEEKVLREWNKSDPVSESEKKRNEYIYKLQHNRNPFVDRPEFVDLINDF